MKIHTRISRLGSAALFLMLLAGCEGNEGTLPGNLPPTTYLSIVGADLDTTDYRKILSWWGSDPDGEVRGYLIRWDGEWRPSDGTAQVYDGMTYALTTATRDTFPVPLGGTYAERTFTVRAVDDQGLVDGIGVTQRFPLSNMAPRLSWNPRIPRPSASLPAVAFGFHPTDDDGRRTVNRFKIWLDGDSANARTVADTVVALWPADFGDRVDQQRTVHIRAYDDALASSNILTHTWSVQSPAGSYLLLDQVTGPGTADWDIPLYRAALDSVAHADLHIINMVTGPEFTTPVAVAPLLSLFQGVAWLAGPYREANDRKMARSLIVAEDGLREYVAAGGRVLLIGQSVLGTNGGLSSAFAREVLGIEDYFLRREMPENRLVTDLPLSLGRGVRFESDDDSLQVRTTMVNVEYFTEPALPTSPLYWVGPGMLQEMMSSGRIEPDQSDQPAYLGLAAPYRDGRITVVTASYARLFDYRNNPGRIGEAVRLFRLALQP